MHLQDTGHPDLQGLVGHDVVGDGHQGVVADIQPLEEREAGEHPGGQRLQTLSSSHYYHYHHFIIPTDPRKVESSERAQLGHVAQAQAGSVGDQGEPVAIRESRMPLLRLHGDTKLSDIDIFRYFWHFVSNHIPYINFYSG